MTVERCLSFDLSLKFELLYIVGTTTMSEGDDAYLAIPRTDGLRTSRFYHSGLLALGPRARGTSAMYHGPRGKTYTSMRPWIPFEAP